MKSVGPLAKQVGAGLVGVCRRYPALVVTPIALIGGGIWLMSQWPQATVTSRSVQGSAPLPALSNPAIAPLALPTSLPTSLPQTSVPPLSPTPQPSSGFPWPGGSPSPNPGSTLGSGKGPLAGPIAPILPSPSGAPIALVPGKAPIGKAPIGQAPIGKSSGGKRPSGIAPLSFDAMVTMKVLIVGKVSGLDLSSSAGGSVSDAQGTSLLRLGEGVRVQASGTQLSWNGQSLPPLVFVDPNPGGLLYVNGKPYRGRLLLTSADGALWAVNYIDLQQYLYSVVGSEVSPSWPIAALKAQTVAARSYALYYQLNPANPLFHIGSDEYYQVYSGARTEAPEVIQAVRETLGEYISHRGGIVESLYAASDDIVSEAFGGQGMSQLGARSFAQQGYSYLQILDHYYPGTRVGRIVVGEG